MRQTFSKSRRIVKGDQFTMILRRGVCVADGVLVMFAVATENQNDSRLGITIPKKAGNAVVRNRWKRLIRESFRTQADAIPCGMDLIVRPKKDAVACWATIQKSVPKLATRAAKKLSSD